MTTGGILAIVFGGIRLAVLLLAFYLLPRLYKKKMQEASRVLGIGQRMAAELERQGQLPGALVLGHPLALCPKALPGLQGPGRQVTT